MKVFKIFTVVSVVLILCLSTVLSSCTGSEPAKKLVAPYSSPTSENWTPGDPVASDSIVLFDSGPSYVGNSASANKNNYPPVAITQATVIKGTTQLHISYRADIEGPRGEIRYNIISVFLTGKDINSSSPQNNISTFDVYTLSVPEGLAITEATEWTGGLSSGSLLLLNVSDSLSTGKYKFDIGLLVNGDDYGTVPCTLTVTK